MNRGQRRAQWLARNRMQIARGDFAGAAEPRSTPLNSVNANRSLALRIDELILQGFPSTSRHPIGDAMQKELVRLITDGGLPLLLAQGDSPRVDAGSFQVRPGTGTGNVGGLIAQALYGGRQR